MVESTYELALLGGINYIEFWDMTLREINFRLIFFNNEAIFKARLNSLAFNDPNKLPNIIENTTYEDIREESKQKINDDLLIKAGLEKYISNKKHFLLYKEFKVKGVD